MQIRFFFQALLAGLLLTASGCLKDQEEPTVTIDIKVPAPVITTLSNGTRKLDFTVEVTQTGDFFYQDFNFKFSKADSTLVLDNYNEVLTDAHQFVHRTVVAPQSGNYRVDVFIGPADGGAGSGSTVFVP